MDDLVERLGSEIADLLHDQIVKSLYAVCREEDTISTIGGSFLSVSLENVVDDDMAERLGFRLYRAAAIAADTVTPGAGELIRMGGARCQAGESVGEARRHATSALRTTARPGNAPVRTFVAADRDLRRRELFVESTVRDAIRSGSIVPHFQAIIDLATDSVAGFEALARLAGPDAPSPGEFIPAAERMGMIEQLSALVSQKAFETAADWPRHTRININISALELPDPRLVDRLLSAAERNRLDTSNIVLEITESTLVDRSPVVARQIDALHATGFRLAIDDYGAGRSSLRDLAEWPISILKLDQILINDIGDRKADTIMRSSIDLAADLGIAVIAEGIETAQQADALKEWGCGYGQGFLYGHPTAHPQFRLFDGAGI